MKGVYLMDQYVKKGISKKHITIGIVALLVVVGLWSIGNIFETVKGLFPVP